MPESETAWTVTCAGGLICAQGRPSTTGQGVAIQGATIESGKEADLLVVEGNPFRNLEELRKVKAVFRGGVKVPCPSTRTISSPNPSDGHA